MASGPITEPNAYEPVAAVIDLAVIGGPGDGKTQFIAHVVRTLGASAPVLDGHERDCNHTLMQLVMDARAPEPVPTPPNQVLHYTFRVRARAIYEQVGMVFRWRLLLRSTRLRQCLAVTSALAMVAAVLVIWLRHSVDGAGVAAATVVLVAGASASWRCARRRFRGLGDVEIVFWDVSGEHLYSSRSADYYEFLQALVRERRSREAPWRRYRFAPVLVCNPLAVSDDSGSAGYLRMRRLLPLFAALDATPQALIAINRWSLVEAVCKLNAPREQRVRIECGDREFDVRREDVRKHCLDAEDGRELDMAVTHLRYEAADVAALEVRDGALSYEPRTTSASLAGDARRTFMTWLGGIAYAMRHEATLCSPVHDSGDASHVSVHVAGDDRYWQPEGGAVEQTYRALSHAASETPPFAGRHTDIP